MIRDLRLRFAARPTLVCAAAMVLVVAPALAQAPRAAQASLRVGISTGGVADGAARAAWRAALAAPSVFAQDSLRRGVSGEEIVGGVAGSAAGMWGGLLAGLAVYELAGSRCTSGCEDGGFGEGVVGLVVGSIAGTALGTHLGAKLAHRRAGSFGHRLMAAGMGFLAGCGAFALLGNDADNTLPLVAFPVAQGVVGALMGHQE